MKGETKNRLIAALDVPGIEAATDLVQTLRDHVGAFKVGMQLFYAEGHRVVAMIHNLGGRVFLDLKLHDIPHTVARACEAVALPGVHMLTVHVSGGVEMMRAAARFTRERARDVGLPKPLILGVTVLTSLDDCALRQIGVLRSPEEQALEMAVLAKMSGLDGVVASPREAVAIRKMCGPEFVIVTPGIRPAGSPADDQRRTATPAEAIRAGADYLVVGRPITAARDPVAAAREIIAEMEAGLDDGA